MATDATIEKQLGGLSRSGKVPKQAKVKNKAPAELQITAEQLLREAKERELEIVPPPPKQKVSYAILKPKLCNYRVFFFILIQEWGCCELILGLLRSQIGSLGPQDWAQITFR